jgi:hypothetical protein
MVVEGGGSWWQAAVECGGSKPFLLCARQQPRGIRAEYASSLAYAVGVEYAGRRSDGVAQGVGGG